MNPINIHFYSQQEKDEFSRWAFDYEANGLDLKQVPVLWNARHGQKLFIYGQESIYETVKKMKDLWLKERKPE